MVEKGMYYAKNEFYEIIKRLGGTWNDTKHRPLVCLIESKEQEGLYWAIPMGLVNHRDIDAQNRIKKFLELPEDDMRSCYYHTGRTTNKSIFFISDSVPITDKYIDSEHLDINKNHFVIKNKHLEAELERKLFRILSFENSKHNYFRQHITDLKEYLTQELNAQSIAEEVAVTSENM